MASNNRRRTNSNAHEWTNFEKHTLLCLMAKGTHLEERGKRNDEPGAMRRHAYLNVASEINRAVNGMRNYGQDIDKKEVAKMIDRMLIEKKGVVGKGGYMERATRGRITRGLKIMWLREPSFDYNGSLSEWKQWRKETEAEKRRVAAGGTPKDGVSTQSIEGDGGQDISAQNIRAEDLWIQADAASSNLSAAMGDQNQLTQEPAQATRRPTIPAVCNHDSFNRLPARLRENDKFAWADPGSSSQNRSSYAGGPSNYDSYRPSGSSSKARRETPYQSPNRYEPTSDSYRPTYREDDDYRPSSSSYHFSDSQPQSTPRNERFDFHSDIIMSTPSIIPDHSSSPAKISSYAGTTCHGAARPTTTISNPYEDAYLARSIEYEMSQRKSSEYKKPGILKRRSEVKDSGDIGDRTPGDRINPARRAMLVERGYEEMSRECMEKVRGPAGKGANKEDLPFNRLENMGRGSSGSDVEMGEGGYY